MDGWKEKKQRMGLLMGGSQRPFYLAEVPSTHNTSSYRPMPASLLLIKGVSGRITPRSLPQSPYLTGKTLAFPCS